MIKQQLVNIYHRIHDFFIYSICGFLASLVNILCFCLFKHIHWQYLLANTMAWLIATSFGFFTNKTIVFKSKYNSFQSVFYQIIKFFSLRSLTLILDTGLMFIGITILHFSSIIAKILDQIIIGIINYYFSRFIFVWNNKINLETKNSNNIFKHF